MAFDVHELEQTAAKLDAVNDRRRNLIEYRDRQLREAASQGVTWARMQKITGLSPRGLAMALKRR